jgi:ABC-type sugar transport system permease subunit
MTRKTAPYVLLIPALVIYVVFSLVPLAGVFKLSMFRTNFVREEFVGLANYVKILTDKTFWMTFGNSCIYFLDLPVNIFISVSFALMLYRVSEGWQTYARVMVYLPGFLGAIILSATWRWVWHADSGLINNIFNLDVPWFSSRWTSVPPIMISSTISGWGGSLIYYCAGLQSIPKETIEAAKVDGASWRQIKYRILLPQLYKLIVLMSLLGTAASFQQFYWSELLAPYPYAGTVMWQLYNVSFRHGKYGLGSAYSVVLMLIILAIVMIQRRIMRRK